MSAVNVAPRSRSERGRTAEVTPLSTPIVTQMVAAPTVSESVTGNAWAMIEFTDSPW